MSHTLTQGTVVSLFKKHAPSLRCGSFSSLSLSSFRLAGEDWIWTQAAYGFRPVWLRDNWRPAKWIVAVIRMSCIVVAIAVEVLLT